MARGDRHHPGIAEADAALRLGGILCLDDRLEHAVLAADEPAIRAGIGGTHPEDDDAGFRRAPALREHGGESRRRQKRGVAEDHEHIVDTVFRDQVGKRRMGGERGMTGPERDGLNGDLRSGSFLRNVLHPRRQHDDGARRRQLRDRIEHVADQRAAGQAVQDFAGGKDDRGDSL